MFVVHPYEAILMQNKSTWFQFQNVHDQIIIYKHQPIKNNCGYIKHKNGLEPTLLSFDSESFQVHKTLHTSHENLTVWQEVNVYSLNGVFLPVTPVQVVSYNTYWNQSRLTMKDKLQQT